MTIKLTLAERITTFVINYDKEGAETDYNNFDQAWWERKMHMFSAIAISTALKETKRIQVWDETAKCFIYAQIEVSEWWRKYEKDASNEAECDVYFMDLQVLRFNGEYILNYMQEINLACKNEIWSICMNLSWMAAVGWILISDQRPMAMDLILPVITTIGLK